MKELIFMLKVMKKLGMPYSFINMIKLLFQDATFLVNIYNQVIGSFVWGLAMYVKLPLELHIFSSSLQKQWMLQLKIWWGLALSKVLFFLKVIPHKSLTNVLTTHPLLWERKRPMWTKWLRFFKVLGLLLAWRLISLKAWCTSVTEEPISVGWINSNGNGWQVEIFPNYLATLLVFI